MWFEDQDFLLLSATDLQLGSLDIIDCWFSVDKWRKGVIPREESKQMITIKRQLYTNVRKIETAQKQVKWSSKMFDYTRGKDN